MSTVGMSLERPKSLDEVVALLGEPGVRILNGGTEITRQLVMGESTCSTLVDIKGVEELSGVEAAGDRLTIGATVRHWDIGASPAVAKHSPVLSAACGSLGNLRVRAQGSLGGNLAYGHPQTDPGAALLSQGATVVVASADGERKVPIEDLWTGPCETSIDSAECVVRIEVDPLPDGWHAAYRRVEILHRPPSLTLGVTFGIDDDRVAGLRIGVGGVSDVPRRPREIESLLQGVPLSQCRAVLEEGRGTIEADLQPVGDQIYSAQDKVRLFINVLAASLAVSQKGAA